MRKWFIFVFIFFTFLSCVSKPEVALTVMGNFGKSTPFELGSFSEFIVDEVITGSLDVLDGDESRAEGTIILIFPPVDTPEIYKNINPDIEQIGYIIDFVDSGKTLDDIELFSPGPGSGMGEFLPPGLLMKDETYFLISKIEGIDPPQ
ncbi:MAG: hypothetical protein JEY99_04470 [Spirochaetales bacterium]|nr:hypothetical protein [Spirochaetales bacterium]